MLISNKIVFTSKPDFKKIAKDEFRVKVGYTKFIDWIGDGIALIQTDKDFITISNILKTKQAIFIRHINPVQIEVNIDFTENALNILKENIKPLLPFINIDESFSVQSRILDNLEERVYGRFEINQELASEIEKTGAKLDVKNPKQILSILCVGNLALIGLSKAEDNLSNWAGGEHRFEREENQVSRSEFKLLEAIEVFNVKIPKKKLALDLGASPGGWTRVLRTYYNMRVISVDPADLNPILVNDNKVSHIRITAQKFIKTNEKIFDVIVDDMKLDVNISIEIMNNASKFLNKNGIAIVTLKLPNKNIIETIEKAIQSLKQNYTIIGIRQLFHNRQEITVVLEKL